MRLMRATPVKAVAGIAVALALLLAACSDDSGNDDTDSTDTTEEAAGPGDDGDGSNDATTTTLSEDEEVLAAYQASTEAVAAAYEAADPEHPDLLATFADQALSKHQITLTNYQNDGIVEKVLSSKDDPDVSRLVGDTATVTDCYVEMIQVLDAATGDARDEPYESRGNVEVQMERIDGTWKVVQGTLQEERCEPGS